MIMGFLHARIFGFKTPMIKFGDGDIGVGLIKEETSISVIDTLILYQIDKAVPIGTSIHEARDADIEKANKDRNVLLIKFEKPESVDIVIKRLQDIKQNLIYNENNNI